MKINVGPIKRDCRTNGTHKKRKQGGGPEGKKKYMDGSLDTRQVGVDTSRTSRGTEN